MKKSKKYLVAVDGRKEFIYNKIEKIKRMETDIDRYSNRICDTGT